MSCQLRSVTKSGQNTDSATFYLEKELFSREILIRVAFTFIKHHHVTVETDDADAKRWKLLLKLKPSSGNSEKNPLCDPAALEGEFRNAVINETFREQLLVTTGKTKQLIVAKALFGAQNFDSKPQNPAAEPDHPVAASGSEPDTT